MKYITEVGVFMKYGTHRPTLN